MVRPGPVAEKLGGVERHETDRDTIRERESKRAVEDAHRVGRELAQLPFSSVKKGDDPIQDDGFKGDQDPSGWSSTALVIGNGLPQIPLFVPVEYSPSSRQ